MDENLMFDWNDDITEDGNETKVLLPGTYPFEVKSFERRVYTGTSASIPNGCKYAEITVRVTDPATNAATLISDKLYLLKKFEWKIGAFLGAVGLKEKGQPISLAKLNDSIGRKGKVKIGCKSDSSENYKKLTAEETADYLKANKTVYNEILSYINKKEDSFDMPKSPLSADEFGFNG
jgi:hypothetical protein